VWVAIVGSRTFGACLTRHSLPPDEAHVQVCRMMKAGRLMQNIVTRAAKEPDFEGIVTGDAQGADHIADVTCALFGVKCQVMRVRSGPEEFHIRAKARNQKIVDKADRMFALMGLGRDSRGTTDAIERALRKGIPVAVYRTSTGLWESLNDSSKPST